MLWRKTVMRITAIALAASMLTAAVPCHAAEADAARAKELSPAIAADNLPSLYEYMTSHRDAEAADEIALPANGASLMNASVGAAAERGSVLRFEKGGYAEWQVSVPRDALYSVALDYCALDTGMEDISFSLSVDGNTPFFGAERLSLKRIWRDRGEITQAVNGNELAPKQEEVSLWFSTYLQDYSTYYSGDIGVFLTAGVHAVRISCADALALDRVRLNGGRKPPAYADVLAGYEQKGYAPAGDAVIKVQAERADYKSDSTLIPVYDTTSSATESADGSLNSPDHICRNTIGQSRWETPGSWIAYRVTVPCDGLYKLQMRTRQNTNIGMSSLRDIYVDGEMPFAEAGGFVIPYGPKWKITTFGADAEHPYWIYLTAGEHEIRFVATLSRFSDVFTELENVNSSLVLLYRRIVMVTGIAPDINRDYKLDAEIPGMLDTIAEAKEQLLSLAEKYIRLSGGGESQIAIIKSNAKQLADFLDDPDTIPARLSNFQSNISSLSDWLLSAKSQALEIDYFTLSGDTAPASKAEQNLLARLLFGFRRFAASYARTYNAIGATGEAGTDERVTVWFNGSRDQAQIIQDLIEDGFTNESGIAVDLSLVYQGYLESILAGCNPDIALDVARSYPVNLACRGALLGLSGFDTFGDVISRYDDGAALPYTYNGEVYGLPSTQTYFMLFYRTDIFRELGIDAPDTWDDFYDTIPVLQRSNYEIGLPYSTITIAGAATGGIGAKDMFATLLFQNGGTVYGDDFTISRLGDEAAFNAFRQWTEFYTTYSFPVSYNLITRFRSGTLPMVIAPYSTYNALMSAAPEIYGLWDMKPIPGTAKTDGTIDRSTGASGTANVIFKNVADPEECWEFLDWWSEDETQYRYAVDLEALLGIASRSVTANRSAFDRLSWGEDVRRSLDEQRQFVVEIPETPGGYILSRSLDNAFRAIVYNGKNIRERYEQEVLTINEELLRKSKEFR